AVRRRVAAVHETVNENVLYFLLLRQLQQREKVLDMGVDAAVAEQTEKMKLALAAALHRLLKKRDFAEGFVGDQNVNFGDVHTDDAAGADIHVADFTVTHLPFGKADSWAGSFDQRVRKIVDQMVVGGLAGKRDGVAFGFGAVPPAVEHRQYNWFRSFG